MAEDKPKRGRPAKSLDERKRNNLTFRVRGDMHERLSNAAELADRSISEEIEFRVARSFEETDIIARALGGHSHADFIRAIALALQIVETKTGASWVSDPHAHREAIVALSKLFRARLFGNDPEWAESLAHYAEMADGIGALAADIASGELSPSPAYSTPPKKGRK